MKKQIQKMGGLPTLDKNILSEETKLEENMKILNFFR